jgi:hypothetical protein
MSSTTTPAGRPEREEVDELSLHFQMARLTIPSSLNSFEQLRHRQVQGRRNPLDVHERQIARTPFHIADIGPMNARQLGQILLGLTEFLPPALHRVPEPFPDVRFGYCHDADGNLM